jgi:RNA recognition motif-containing protein
MDVDQREQSNWLKITNLDSKVSDKELAAHILNNSKTKPKFLEIYAPSKGKQPPFAIVQMQSLKDAAKVIQNLRMSKLKGQKMSTQSYKGKHKYRGEFKKGSTEEVILCHLPMHIKEGEIRKMCSQYGAVKEVKINMNKRGYFMRSAIVTMSSKAEASSVFDGLNEEKVKGSTITTRFSVEDNQTNRFIISSFPQSVSQGMIRKFVKEAVGVSPTHVEFRRDEQDAKVCAMVKFSNYEHVVQCISELNGKKLGGQKVKVETEESFHHKRGGRKVKAERKKGGLDKMMANMKIKGSAFSGKKKVEKPKNPLKGKGEKRVKQKKKGIKK